MHKGKFNKPSMWVVMDLDGLYICNSKPWKSYYGEHAEAFNWECEGDFMRLYLPTWANDFKDMKFADDPVRVNVELFCKDTEKEDE